MLLVDEESGEDLIFERGCKVPEKETMREVTAPEEL